MEVRATHSPIIRKEIGFLRSKAGHFSVGASLAAHSGFIASLADSAYLLTAAYGSLALGVGIMVLTAARIIYHKIKDPRRFPADTQKWLGQQQHALIDQAQKAVSGSEEIDNWGRFLASTEVICGDQNKLQALQYGNYEEVLSKLENKLRRKLAKVPEDDFLGRMDKFSRYLYRRHHLRYTAGHGTLIHRLIGWGANCEAQAKLLTALAQRLFDWTKTNWKPALALYSDHIEFVLFDKEMEQVYDVYAGKVLTREDVPAAIFDINLFAYAFLQGEKAANGIDHDNLLLLSYGEKEHELGENFVKKTTSKYNYSLDMFLPSFAHGAFAPVVTKYPHWIMRVAALGIILSFAKGSYEVVKAYLEFQACKKACAEASVRKNRFVPNVFFDNPKSIFGKKC